MTHAVARNGLPKIIRILKSSRISRITKSIGRMNLLILITTFSAIPRGYWMNLSVSSKLILVGFGSPSPNFSHIELGIRLILAPKSAKALSMCKSPISQGIAKLPGSFPLSKRQENWNGSSKVPVMKDMIQTEKPKDNTLMGGVPDQDEASRVYGIENVIFAHQNSFLSLAFIVSDNALDTPYRKRVDTPDRELIYYAYSCDQLSLIRHILFAGYDMELRRLLLKHRIRIQREAICLAKDMTYCYLGQDDYDSGSRKPSDLEDGFYRDTTKLGPEYLTEIDDEGEVT
nr:hypothetical protein [Tanacetum cinerariifolium]